jgi:hypothetical protein
VVEDTDQDRSNQSWETADEPKDAPNVAHVEGDKGEGDLGDEGYCGLGCGHLFNGESKKSTPGQDNRDVKGGKRLIITKVVLA